jgi:hypothetical protein
LGVSDASRRSNLTAWFLLLVGLVGLIWMMIVMMRSTGDQLHEARVEVPVYAAPGIDAEVLGSLSPGDRLQCHTVVEGQPEWLNCSDMLERKYVPADAMRPVVD